jgi:hypothetical protein
MSNLENLNYSDGSKSKLSKAVVIAVSKPPQWRSPFAKDEDPSVSSLNFENIYVYNFYTLEERTRYSFNNPHFFPAGKDRNLTHPRVDVDSAIRDITGKTIIDPETFDNFNRTVNERIPSYIRLCWKPPPGFENSNSIASQSDIDAFAYLGGVGQTNLGNSHRFSPLTRESFELQQRQYVGITNEYLDMFSFGEDGKSTNNWFAEEVDSTFFQPRLQFLYDSIVQPNKKYKNFANQSATSGGNAPMMSNQNLNSADQNFKNTNGNPSESPGIVQVVDSALLEDLNLPIHDKVIPEDTTIVLNSDYAWSLSRASSKSSGLLLNMQTRMRNVRYWQEVLTKAGYRPERESQSITFDDVFENTGLTSGPLESIFKNAKAYEIEELNRFAGDDDLTFKIVGFVIEKTQKVETEKTTTIDDVETETPEEDEVPFDSEKFPLIFIPCSRDSVVTSYLDAAVNYDKEYDYTVRAVYSFHLTVPIDEGENRKAITFKYFLNSPYSTLLTVETREVLPPPYPRDVWAFHEYYTGEDGCLALHWAFPVNKQRDVTYFAVFRRKSIYEPFQLLKVYDFNYSITDENQSAREIKPRIFGHASDERFSSSANASNSSTRNKITRLSSSDCKTMYKDKSFKPDTEYIYAVCAIDAHGQMSNYSSQIKVRLDSKLYELKIQQISPPGAPLVFPNYFVKTKAFQDVARASNYKRAVLRFRPDYKSVKIGERSKNIVNGIDAEFGGNEANSYFLQIINPDRANDIILKYQIDDKLVMENDEETLRNIASLIGMPKRNLIN